MSLSNNEGLSEDVRDIEDLEFTIVKKWLKRINQYIEIKEFLEEDTENILAQKSSFRDELSFESFIVSLCVIDFEVLCAMLDAMGISNRVSPAILTHEMYDLCKATNPSLLYEKTMKIKLKEIREKIKKMFDKRAKNAYVWYSGATDITGSNLAEAIGADHGKDKPDFSKYDLIIGWGTKMRSKTVFGKIKALNNPNQILVNRDKFEALKIMHDKKVSVAGFVGAAKAIVDIKDKKNGVKFPLIGRTKYHQGGKGFWICPTMTHIRAALDDGAKYFQNMIEIKHEYRLHIFDGKVIYAVKKTKKSKEEYMASYITQELESQKKLAEKNNNPFDEATAKLIIERIAKKKVASGADMIIRSNKLGWKFSHVKSIDKILEREATKALKALNLDFGAVDCCIDVNNTPYIIEVNTGPGLEKTSFDIYVKAFKNILVNKSEVTVQDEEVKGKVTGTTKVKNELLAKTALFTEMIEKSDEGEATALKGIFKKMFD